MLYLPDHLISLIHSPSGNDKTQAAFKSGELQRLVNL
jgi:hypothetical protein